MEYKDLEKVNSEIKSTPIKGKEYAEVNQRILAFRKLYPEGTIETELVEDSDGRCVFKATVIADEKVLGTGYAYEKESSSFINKTSYIENCETSAVGRALGMVGIGVNVSVASYEEVANAMTQQGDDPMVKEGRDEMLKYIEENYDDENKQKILEYYHISELKYLKTKDLTQVYLQKKAGK